MILRFSVFEIWSLTFLESSEKELKNVVPKNAQCSETDFTLNLTILRFLVFKIWSVLYLPFVVKWGLRDFCEPDSGTLTSDTQ